MGEDPRVRLARGAGHPVCLSAVAVLVVNDHLWKGVGPGWLTGKLSDVAWLVVAPVVLAVLLSLTRLSVQAVRSTALGATALAYLTLQLWPPLGEAWVALFGGAHVADVEDLVALPALALAPLCWRPTRPRRWALPVASVALLATSYGQPPVDHAPCTGEPDWDAMRPLTLRIHSGGASLDPELPGAMEGLRLEDELGNAVELAWVSAQGVVSICPIGGLRLETSYHWVFPGSREVTSNQQPLPSVEGVDLWFSTGTRWDWPAVERAEDCYVDVTWEDACWSESSDTGDTGDDTGDGGWDR